MTDAKKIIYFVTITIPDKEGKIYTKKLILDDEPPLINGLYHIIDPQNPMLPPKKIPVSNVFIEPAFKKGDDL